MYALLQTLLLAPFLRDLRVMSVQFRLEYNNWTISHQYKDVQGVQGIHAILRFRGVAEKRMEAEFMFSSPAFFLFLRNLQRFMPGISRLGNPGQPI